MKIERNPFRDYSVNAALFVRLSLVELAGIFLLTGILIVNLYHLQIVRFENDRTRSNENRIKLVSIVPGRGIIYARKGTPLALNRTIYQLEQTLEKVDALAQTIAALRPIVDLTDDDIATFEKERKHSRRFTSLSLKVTLTNVQQARFAVNQYRFPGAEFKNHQRRYYIYSSSLITLSAMLKKLMTATWNTWIKRASCRTMPPPRYR